MKKIETKLSLRQLKLAVYLGWPDAERRRKQTVWVDIDMVFHTPPSACVTDDLTGSFCYDELTKKIKAHVQQKTFRLIEHLARDIYECVTTACPLAEVGARVTKHPPVPGLHAASFWYGTIKEN